MAHVVVTPDAARQLEDLPKPMQQRVTRILERLEKWPDVSGAKALAGDLAGRYRIRTGDYRVQFYGVKGKPADEGEPPPPDVVFVEKMGHRDGFYGD